MSLFPKVDYKDFWEWNQATDAWTQKADFPGAARSYAVGFSMINKGYVSTGYNYTLGYAYNDLWEYDPALNTWVQKADYPGKERTAAVVFTIGYKAYMGTGVDILGGNFNDFWEYDAFSNTWMKMANFPLSGIAFTVGFSIGNKGYVGTGNKNPNMTFNALWELDPGTNSWAQKANLPSKKRDDAVGFSIGNYGYIGLGDSIYFPANKYVPLSDFWQYSPNTNSWTQMANYGGGAVASPSEFVIGCRGYVTTGWSGPTNFSGPRDDLWEFTPPIPSAVVAGVSTFCAGDSTSLFASGGLFFQWSTGETTNIIDVKPTTTTTYSVIVFDACGADTADITVNVIQYPVISVNYDGNVCGRGVVQFTDNSMYGNTWYWDFGDGNTSTAQNPTNIYTAGQYAVTVTVSPSPSSFGCNSTSQFPIEVFPFSELFIPNAFSPNDDGNSDVYYIFGSCITPMTFTIYNRWGEKVFETQDPSVGWDGKYNGETQNAGVFMYSFNGTSSTGETITRKGNITLMR